jgi:hypothetical protein
MRSDMAKVIVERPRTGGGGSFPLRTRPDCDRLPPDEWLARQGMRRPWLKGHHKHLNENLAPLKRYLQSQVGRPWTKVYSEICQRINRNSAVQLHIWQHLMQYVCTDPYVARGVVRRPIWHYHLYIVDPRNGLLRENPRRSRKHVSPAPAPDPDCVPIDHQSEYRRLDGIWYELRLATPPQHRDTYDFAIRNTLKCLDDATLRKFYGRLVYAAGKRQLNKNEIRRIGLPPASEQ